MQWFKASGWRFGGAPLITAVEVISETECFLTVPNRWRPGIDKPERVAKSSEGERYFQTWEAARDFLLDRCGEQVKSCRSSLERANGALGNVKGWKNPTNQEPS